MSRRLFAFAIFAIFAGGSAASAPLPREKSGASGKGRRFVICPRWADPARFTLYEAIVHDPRLLWPDTLDLTRDGYLYVTANQMHRQGGYNQGRDRREKPYSLFRVRVGSGPVLLRGSLESSNR